MSNSKLASLTRLSPNYNSRGDSKIKKITIHHMAGDLSLEGCYNAVTSRGGSANYAIDSDGKIGMFVEEKNRAWTSNSRENDFQAITIEVANDGGEPDWHVSGKALAALINLCVDICKRNGIKRLNFTGDASGNLTMHKYFAATACPGPYLGGKFPYIAEQVNLRLVAKKPKVLDKSGFKKGERSAGVFAVKRLLQCAYLLGLVKSCPSNNGLFGGSTERAVNALLKKWGYSQNGIAGVQFIARLSNEVKRAIRKK